MWLGARIDADGAGKNHTWIVEHLHIIAFALRSFLYISEPIKSLEVLLACI
jgi:hypothetical protein